MWRSMPGRVSVFALLLPCELPKGGQVSSNHETRFLCPRGLRAFSSQEWHHIAWPRDAEFGRGVGWEENQCPKPGGGGSVEKKKKTKIQIFH